MPRLSLSSLRSVHTLSGWRRNAAAFAFGVTGTLTLAPFFFFPLLIVSFAGLYRLIEAAPTRRRIFWDGWWWGWGFYMTGLYWFCIALLTDPAKFGWLIPFTLFGLTGVIALYAAFTCGIFSLVRVRGLGRIFLFALIWTLFEYARSCLFSGFPWNLPGYAFEVLDSLAQLGSFIGIYGLTWCAVWFGTLPVAYADASIPRKQVTKAMVVTLAALVAAFAWGHTRLQQAAEEEYVDGVKLRLVQANISQHHKWDPRLQMQEMQKHVRLTMSPGLESITHVIWPETAVPYAVKSDTPLTHMLASVISPNMLLIAGGLRIEGEGADMEMYNSIVAIDKKGELAGHYDKFKLVPFGEFLPFRSWLPKFLTTPVGEKDFGRGPGPLTLKWDGLPQVSPLICYEAIFPSLAVSKVERPQWLLNVTNDAWFGISSGPYQHFHMARMRSIEQGLPLVRVANTGISALTDRFGQVLESLPLGTQGVMDVRLPVALEDPTFYGKHGDWVLGVLVFFGLILIIRQQKKTVN